MPEQENRETLRDRNRRLRDAINELSILNDIATAVSSVSTLDEVIGLIVKKCVKHLDSQQCTVTLLENETENSPFRTFVREIDTSREIQPMRLDSQIAGWMIKNNKPLIVNDINNDSRFHPDPKSSRLIRSMLCAPLTHKGKLIGSINLFNKRSSEGFTEDNRRLLAIIASQSAQVIKNARLLEEEKAYQALKEEMKMAYRIQMELLPSSNPMIEGYDIAGSSIPAKAVGGDYFDFIPAGENGLAVCIGDVVGKGMPAALLMSSTQATLRAQVENQLSPAEVMDRSNSLLFRSTDAGKFVTLFLAYLDTERNRIRYCNAGHEYPLVFRKGGRIERLETDGLILGAIEAADFGESETGLEPGDIVVLYSDGITEAFNMEGEQFGPERLRVAVEGRRDSSSEMIISGLIESISDFAGGREQSDDITLVVIRREE
ncbi:MAG: SpoIIE family protein phosphatase [Candidatus Latescibacteria bacterium]|nr:SpoIIE family protein phosphatase [bacterium]MBD3423781.1 SpoIIE family protein phosphatase [Candidatus Latescibacterota bacterium]